MTYIKYHNHCGDQSVHKDRQKEKCAPRALFPPAAGSGEGEHESVKAPRISVKFIENGRENANPAFMAYLKSRFITSKGCVVLDHYDSFMLCASSRDAGVRSKSKMMEAIVDGRTKNDWGDAGDPGSYGPDHERYGPDRTRGVLMAHVLQPIK
jgi:hypothetical protein